MNKDSFHSEIFSSAPKLENEKKNPRWRFEYAVQTVQIVLEQFFFFFFDVWFDDIYNLKSENFKIKISIYLTNWK